MKLIVNSKKLLILFSLVISCPLLFGTGCICAHGKCADIISYSLYDLNKRSRYSMHMMQMNRFSLCTEQKQDCVEHSGYADRIITIAMPYGTNVKKLVASFEYEGYAVYIGKTKQVSGKTVNDFTYPVVYRVESRSGSSNYYYVKVITAPEKTIYEFFLTGWCARTRAPLRFEGVIDQNTKNASVVLSSRVVKYCESSLKLKANFRYSGTSLAGPKENDFTSPAIYTVRAKDGSSVNYTVSVTIVPENIIYEFMIDTFCAGRHWNKACVSARPPDTLYSGHIDQKNKSITVNLPDRDGIDIKKLHARFKSSGYDHFIGRYSQITGLFEGKSVSPLFDAGPIDFSTPVIYRLKAEDGMVSDYTVGISIIPEKTMTEFFLSECIDYCEKYHGVIDEKAKTISVRVPNNKKGKALSSLKANFSYSGSSVLVDQAKQISGITENDFSSPVVYRIVAKDGSFTKYTVTVTFPTDAPKM